MASVSVQHLSRRFGEHLALDDVSIALRSGELYGLLGPSGSGKTTLLRLIAGFDHADDGEILMGGERVESVPVERRHIGMVFQSYALFPNLTVAGNVAFGLAVRSVARAEIRQRVAAVLDLVRLDKLGDRRPYQLSGGQRQRVALARAIVTEPRVLLLDEPLGALDKSLRQSMQTEIRRIQRETGLTTIFVTHDQEEALTISDRVGILRNGRLEQEGAPSVLYDRPANAFVASFLGNANLFEGMVEGGVIRLSDGTCLHSDDELPHSGQTVHCAVRPERVRLVDLATCLSTTSNPMTGIPANKNHRPIGNRVTARIVSATFSGASVTYHLVREGKALQATEPNDGRSRRNTGETVMMEWKPAATVVLGSFS